MKLEQHFNERNRRDLGIVWFIISLIVMLGGFSGGLVFSLLGVIWLASARGEGLEWAREHPDLMKTGLLAVTIVMILLFVSYGKQGQHGQQGCDQKFHGKPHRKHDLPGHPLGRPFQ